MMPMLLLTPCKQTNQVQRFVICKVKLQTSPHKLHSVKSPVKSCHRLLHCEGHVGEFADLQQAARTMIPARGTVKMHVPLGMR